jgi:hypothetical protein
MDPGFQIHTCLRFFNLSVWKLAAPQSTMDLLLAVRFLIIVFIFSTPAAGSETLATLAMD